MIAVQQATLAQWLDRYLPISHSYKMPLYYTDEEPEAVELLYSIWGGTVDPEKEAVPPLSTISAMAQLCARAGRLRLCERHISTWVRRWMAMSYQNLSADVLSIALECGNEELIVETYRVLVLGNVTNEQVRRGDLMIGFLPNHGMPGSLPLAEKLPLTCKSVRLLAVRCRIRQTLRTLIQLPIADHVTVRSANAPHVCHTQALDLTAYVEALYHASLFPFPEDGNDMCLIFLGPRLNSARRQMPFVEDCRECGFQGNRAGAQLEAVGRALGTLLKEMMTEFKAHVPIRHMGQCESAI